VSEQQSIVAVLAGGRGRRLGGGKPTALLAGRPLICRPLEAARAAGLETIVLAKPGDSLPVLTERVVYDRAPTRHPLSGLLAALAFAAERSPAPAVVALACDMPFLSSQLLEWLAGFEEPAVAEVDGRLQPLLARYLPTHIPTLEQAMRHERPLREAVAQLGLRRIGEPELVRFGAPRRLCFNVNDREELQLAERWLAEG
jgi:molybdenum cofactor guanylyltransferase